VQEIENNLKNMDSSLSQTRDVADQNKADIEGINLQLKKLKVSVEELQRGGFEKDLDSRGDDRKLDWI